MKRGSDHKRIYNRKGWTRRDFLKATGTAAVMAGSSGIFAPAIIRAAKKPIKIGHLVPQTGFLSAMGEYEIYGASMAVEEINAAGGCLGRKLELLIEDVTNPGIGVQKVTKLIKRDKVDAMLGLVSSSVCLAVMKVAERYKTLLLNTGANSDEIRGKQCNMYTFSVEACNTQYVNTIGSYLLKEKQYKKWYFLTSDYAFGHDLLRVSRGLLNKIGGDEVVQVKTHHRRGGLEGFPYHRPLYENGAHVGSDQDHDQADCQSELDGAEPLHAPVGAALVGVE